MLGGRELRSSCNVGGADGVKRQQDCRTPKNSGLRRAELALSSDWDALKPLTQHFVLGENLLRPSMPSQRHFAGVPALGGPAANHCTEGRSVAANPAKQAPRRGREAESARIYGSEY